LKKNKVIKQRLQAGLHDSIFEALQYSFKHEGLLGLFATGKLFSQIVRDVPYAIITLVTYEILQELFKKKKIILFANTKNIEKDNNINNKNGDSNSILIESYSKQQKIINNIICGSIAGGVGSFLTTPMDVVKTRLMTTTSYTSVFHAIACIAQEEKNLKGFFKGVVPRVMHKIPANGIFFCVYEIFKNLLHVDRTKE
jgi:solute carrier family 25 S-adenosylmethionine transporter 26